MKNFLDEFMKNFGDEYSEQFSNQFKVENNKVSQLIPQILSLILYGLKKQKDENCGAEKVNHLLNRYGKDRVTENIEEIIVSVAKYSDIDLIGISGESGLKASRLLGQMFNVDAKKLQIMIHTLTQIVLRTLYRKKNSCGFGMQYINALLEKEGAKCILEEIVDDMDDDTFDYKNYYSVY